MRLAARLLFLISLCVEATAQTSSPGKKELRAPTAQATQLLLAPYHYDPRLLLNYSAAELDTLRAYYPNKFANVENYLLRSYTVDTVDCSNCSLSEFLRQFNITQYEKYRRKNKPAVIYTKTGYRITILPVNSLSFSVPIFRFAKDE